MVDDDFTRHWLINHINASLALTAWQEMPLAQIRNLGTKPVIGFFRVRTQVCEGFGEVGMLACFTNSFPGAIAFQNGSIMAFIEALQVS